MSSSGSGGTGTGGIRGSGGSTISAGGGGGGSAGSAGAGEGGHGGNVQLPPAHGTPGTWENVSPPGWDPGPFGIGSVVGDPAKPTDLYAGGQGSVWKSTDYGSTWSRIDSNPNPPSIALGLGLAVAGTSPATIWMPNVNGDQKVYKSTDAGKTFHLTGLMDSGGRTESFYSVIVDPTDSKHLLTGFHEADKLAESNDGGETWHYVTGPGWPSGGFSYYPFFIDMHDGASPMKTWFVIGQGGSPALTTDGGAHWKVPAEISTLGHPHGNASLYQNGNDLFIAGYYDPGGGTGIYRSTNLGQSWLNVASGNEALVWGTPKALYAMWAWACAKCTGGTSFKTAPHPGTTWKSVDSPMQWGPNSMVVTSDGKQSIFVGAMWWQGIWRYLEP
jgi:photosystem II stability/assembly factor-like uncharacterized protein